MKKLILMLMLLAPMTMFAQTKFGYIDSQAFLESLPEAQAVQKALQAKGDEYQKNLAESLKSGDIDRFVLNTGVVCESELRKTPLEGHLATLEANLVLVSGACLGTLGTTGSGAALSRAFTTTDTFFTMGSAFRWFQF